MVRHGAARLTEMSTACALGLDLGTSGSNRYWSPVAQLPAPGLAGRILGWQSAHEPGSVAAAFRGVEI